MMNAELTPSALRRKLAAMATPMKGISRIDQPAKRTHGFFVRLARGGKIHSAFFSDLTHGGRENALAAAQLQYEKWLVKFGPVKKSMQARSIEEAVGGGPETNPGRPQPLDAAGLKWVQGRGFRCLAYLDESNRWVNFYTGRVLDGTVKLIC